VTERRTLISDRYVDAWGRDRVVDPLARRRVLEAMGLDPDRPEPRDEPVLVASPGRAIPPAELVLEDGSSLGSVDQLPADLPIGYHRLLRDGGEQLVLSAPPRCHLPADLYAWGWAVQVYALRSAHSWGIGDLADVRQLSAAAAEMGAGLLLLSPLGAPSPGPHADPSPYYPSSRRYRNVLHLAIADVPGADGGAELDAAITAGRALNDERAIDRPRALAAKLDALDRLWQAGIGTSAVRGRVQRDTALRQWGTFVALAERHGPNWRTWPAELRDPRGAAVERAAHDLGDRVAFHAWIQLELERQLAAAAEPGVALVIDLPVGFDPAGFDAWTWQAELADGASLGAPPDRFNPVGQVWGLPPFAPHQLRRSRYRPLIETLRACLLHAGGLRIDHVLGLFRQWWVPTDADPGDGAYVRQPTDELLAVLAIESRRARAVIVGEDLGTVEPGVRRRLAAANVLSTRLALFERLPPSRWPRKALVGVTTHDLPSIAGLWTDADLEAQRAAGLDPDRRATEVLRRALRRVAGVGPEAALEDVVLAVHAAVGSSPSALAVASLDDAVLSEERTNIPGTVPPARLNWSRALPRTVEEIADDPFVRQLAAAIGRARRAPRPG
jgi:4-alpha-glucanotransferase